MDKKTLIGLGLIGVILAVFTFMNQPTEEELKAYKEEQEQLAKQQEAESKSQEVKTESKKVEEVIEISDSLATEEQDSIQITETVQFAKSSADVFEETFTLENDKIQLVLSNKGGGVKSVFLKDHQTYDNYKINKLENESDSITPLEFYNEFASSNSISFNDNGKAINTRELAFTLSENKEGYISLIAQIDAQKSIEQIYSIQPGEQHINYEIKFNGFENGNSNVFLDWNADLLKTEKLLKEQRRVSTIFYQEKGGKYKYLSEMSDDDKNLKTGADWVAFKQSYFSSILIPEKSFVEEGSYLKVTGYSENSAMDSTHIKNYEAHLNLGINNLANGYTSMRWYFGPNDYDLLSSYDNGIHDVMNYGWGIFRWINIYVIQPLFVWIAGWGVNLGIAILILTIIVKGVLTPIQWKMFSSSAKMRILKPEIDEINQKYPNKDDAMKKQMEMMTLYKESGASPLSGCVPMLIQMPILVAVFRFFPATFTLRQKGFLWADDLSSYDSILDLSFNIPFYGSHVSLFTLLMAATTLFYTMLNGSQMQQPSQPGMPNMKVIMYIFPVMMIFFFNNYASGLSFYYFISTLVSILTMILIKNYFVDEEKLKAKMATKKVEAQNSNKKGVTKSKFQQRLEEMQKAQQEKLKNQRKK